LQRGHQTRIKPRRIIPLTSSGGRAADEPFLHPAHRRGALDPRNIWTTAELDRWAAAATQQQLALIHRGVRLLDSDNPNRHQLLHHNLLLIHHWFKVSVRIQRLREELLK
jgi:hypothetical protein